MKFVLIEYEKEVRLVVFRNWESDSDNGVFHFDSNHGNCCFK